MKEIKLHGKYGEGKITLVDDEDYAFLNQYKWNGASHGCYAVAWSGWPEHTTFRMHKLLMKPPKGLEVDHINRNKLDNQKENLRICTHLENIRNSNIHKGKTINYKGVGKFRGKYKARICNNYKLIDLGVFNTPEDAAKAYDIKAIELFGEFANLNFKKELSCQ